jgi:xanthine dehydrogenase YagS FAD-binding subunit
MRRLSEHRRRNRFGVRVREFAFERPHSAEAALASGARPDASYLGGGTNLVDLMKLGVQTPQLIVDLSSIDWAGIELGPDGFRVGAMVRNTDLAVDPQVRSWLPLLAQAVVASASPQVRNVATVAGNLLQHTRCRYYLDVTKACNRRVPSSGCPARAGDHRNLAILGTSDQCVATHPSDLAVALVALDTEVTVLHTDRTRKVIGLERLSTQCRASRCWRTATSSKRFTSRCCRPGPVRRISRFAIARRSHSPSRR